MTRAKKTSWVLCISIILMLLSSIVTMAIQTSFGKVSVTEINWETTTGNTMNGGRFVPDPATAETPAPAIVVSHGMYNNKGMQDLNFVELSRRGYVVLAQDMPNHGDSENVESLGTVTMGLYESVKVLANMNNVDASRIGITGHSLGGMSCNVAVSLDNAADQPLIAAVLLNSADATYTGEDGFANIYGSRDVGIVAGQYDEWFFSDVDANGNPTLPKDFVANKNAQSFLHFGTDPEGQDVRAADTVYTETIDGQEAMRVIYNPAIIHPWSHFSQRSTVATISFFEQALGAPNPLSATDQIWQWKVVANTVGLVAFFLFIVSLTLVLVRKPFFSEVGTGKDELVAPRPTNGTGKVWFFASILICAIICTIIYLPIMNTVPSNSTAHIGWPQSQSLGIGTWAAACGVVGIISMLISYYAYGKKHGVNPADIGLKISVKKALKTILLALIVIAAAFGCLAVVDYLFMADFRIWTLAVRAFNAEKLWVSLWYVLFFLVYYVGNSVAANCFNYNDVGDKHGWLNTALLAIAAALPAPVLLLIQYIPFLSGGNMTWPGNNMQIVWLFPMLVILPLAVVISRFIYRRTKNPYLPGLIMGIFVTLITCSNSLTLVV